MFVLKNATICAFPNGLMVDLTDIQVAVTILHLY